MTILLVIVLVLFFGLLAFAWYGKKSVEQRKREWKQQQEDTINYINSIQKKQENDKA